MGFLKDVKGGMKKGRFPNKKEMITYSVATISLVIFFALYFGLLDLIIAGIKTLINGY